LGAIDGAAGKLALKLSKACVSLSSPDLLAADGLGYAATVGECADELGLNVCADRTTLLRCIADQHVRSAERLFDLARPRAFELLAETGISPSDRVPFLPEEP